MNVESLFENKSAAERTMTTKELVNVFGGSSDSILLAVNRLNLTENIRQVPINGKMGYVFTAAQATAIKIELQNHSKIAMNTATESKTEKDKGKQTKSALEKTGLIRAERSDRSLLKGHVTHLINHG